METLTKISKRYATTEEANNHGFKPTEYQVRDIFSKLEDLKEFSKFGKLIPAVDVFTREDGSFYFENVTVFFEYKGYLLRPTTAYNKKMYGFYLVDSFRVKDSYYKNENPEPNRIGKPTAKKLDDWLNYILTEEEDKKRIQAEADNKTGAFLEKLEKTGLKIQWAGQEKRQGWITTEELEYSFFIQDNGYVTEKITARKTGLDTFLKLTAKN